MLETSARLLRLLSLFQAQRYWPGVELAGRLEVTARTLRRDVAKLRSLGYPVNSTAGTGGGYQLGAGATLPPLLLDDNEAVAVAVGLRTAASGSVAGIEEASVRALSKLQQVRHKSTTRRPAKLSFRDQQWNWGLHQALAPLLHAAPKFGRLLMHSRRQCRADSSALKCADERLDLVPSAPPVR